MLAAPRIAAVALAALVLAACADAPPSAATHRFPNRWAREWFDVAYAFVRDAGLSPPPASRLYGYLAVTYYEAVQPGNEGAQSLSGQLNGLGSLPQPDLEVEHDWPAVANAAMAVVVRGLVPAAPVRARTHVTDLERRQGAERRGAVGDAVYERSVAHGEALGAAILAWADGDGYSALADCPYTAPVGPGLWQPTPPGFLPPLQPCWGMLRTFALRSGDACDARPPIPTSNDPASRFHAETREVYEIVKRSDPEEVAIARFWSDDPGVTGTPPGHWMAIVGQVAAGQGLDLARTAEAYARTGIAVADAFISCWHTKYLYNYPRPVTAVRALLDPSWSPILPTPPFPEYTSGHSVQSGAASEVLTDLLGDVPLRDETHAARGLPARSFESLRAAAGEAALSRIYGGIHFREACEVGLEQGVCVARGVLDHVRFRDR